MNSHDTNPWRLNCRQLAPRGYLLMGGQVVSLALVPAVEDHVTHLALPVAESLKNR